MDNEEQGNDTWMPMSEKARINPITGCLLIGFVVCMEIWNFFFPIQKSKQ